MPINAKVAAARLSIISNSSLTLIKLAAGIATGSVSVLSEAVHSATDLLASWIAFFSVKVADRPADESHPFGHGKAENLSGLAEAGLILVAAAWIVFEAVHNLLAQEGPHRLDLGIAVMSVSVVVNILVAGHLSRVARETDSMALEADAQHLWTDVRTSIAVLVGLSLAWFTGWSALDPLVAIGVAFLVAWAGWKLALLAFQPLMDSHLPDEELEEIRRILASDAAVLSFHKLRTRKAGSMRHVDAHILLDDDLSLLEAHDLAEAVEDKIRNRFPGAEITLHVEPFRAETQHQFEQHGGPEPL